MTCDSEATPNYKIQLKRVWKHTGSKICNRTAAGWIQRVTEQILATIRVTNRGYASTRLDLHNMMT